MIIFQISSNFLVYFFRLVFKVVNIIIEDDEHSFLATDIIYLPIN